MDASNRIPRLPISFRVVRAFAPFCVTGALVLASATCGKRGDPLPPLRPVPAPVPELFVAQRGEQIHLEWTAPSQNQDGSLNVDLEKVEVLRRIIEIPPPPPSLTPTPTGQPGLGVTGVGQEVQTTLEAPAAETTGPQEGVQPGEAQEPEPDQEKQEVETTQEVEPGEESQEEDEAEESTEGEEPGEEPKGSEGEEPSETAQSTLLMQAPVAPAPFPAGSRVIATLESLELGEPLIYDDTWIPSMEGKRVEYGVRHFNRKGRASIRPSFVAQIEPRPPFAPPEEVTAEVVEGAVTLNWIAPPEPVEPESAEAAAELPVAEPESAEKKYTYAFNVFKKSSTDEFYPRQSVNAEPIDGSSFNDRRVVFGKPWCYVVRRVAVLVPEEPISILDESLVSEGIQEAGELLSQLPGSVPIEAETATAPAQPTPSQTTTAPAQPATPLLPGTSVAPGLAQAFLAPPPLTAPLESADSEEVCLTPQDTYAPATPEDLFAVPSPEGILLSWREVSTSDLKGYRVYRAERRQGPFDLLTPVPVRLGSFTDRSVEPGKEYFYKVSAVDREEPPNESPHSPLAGARASEP